MSVRRLGWAGVELEAAGETILIDPLADPAAVFAPLGPAADGELPAVVRPLREQHASAALLTHLHRDHADAAALRQGLAPGSPVYQPYDPDGDELENLGVIQAASELAAIDIQRRGLSPWERERVGPFAITALPAVDGLGDPQLSWLVEVQGARVLHLGDTLFHGYWWRMAIRHGPFDVILPPINGAVVQFPHRQPPSPRPAAMDPEDAALAGELLQAATVVPIHYGGFAIEPYYRPVAAAEERFLAAAEGKRYSVQNHRRSTQPSASRRVP